MRYSPEAHRLGMQEGRGIFSAIGKWVKGAVKTTGKFLKKHKVPSKVLGFAGNVVGMFPGPKGKIGSIGLKLAAKGVRQAGWGPSRRCKNITASQVAACQAGYGRWLPSGAISLALARKYVNKGIKNISPAQVNALRQLFGRVMKGGGITLAGGGPSGYYAVTGQAGKGWKIDFAKNILKEGAKAGARAGVSRYAQPGRGQPGEGWKLELAKSLAKEGAKAGARYGVAKYAQPGRGVRLAGAGVRLAVSGPPMKRKRYAKKKKILYY